MIFENETFVRLQGSLSFNCGRKCFDRMDFTGRKPPQSRIRSKPECAALTPSYERNNSGGTKALNGENNHKAQRSHKRRVHLIHLA